MGSGASGVIEDVDEDELLIVEHGGFFFLFELVGTIAARLPTGFVARKAAGGRGCTGDPMRVGAGGHLGSSEKRVGRLLLQGGES